QQLVLQATAPQWTARFVAGGASIVTGGEDGVIRLWNAEDGSVLAEARLDFHQMRMSGDAKAIARLGALAMPIRLDGHLNAARAVEPRPDGIRAVVGGQRRLEVRDAMPGRTLVVLADRTAPIEDIVFSGDGARLAAGSADKVARVWEVRTGRL